MKTPRFLIVTAVFCLLSAALSAQNGIGPRLNEYLHTIDIAEEPRIIEEHLVLSYSAGNPVRYVAAAFAHEEFSRLHIYDLNQNGIFVLPYSLPKERSDLRYRIIVDGLWMRDPFNPEISSDSRGIPISKVTIPRRPPRSGEMPLILADGTVEFVYYGRANQRVRLTGEFNRWSPFAHPMRETEPGEYRIRLPLYEGLHRYRFVVNGQEISDPLNPRIAYDVLGNQASAVNVAYPGSRLAEMP